ncbi:glycosyltransferase family 2 protein [Baekduia soli]|uniref:glycosyltransferase family 2 protein n=1 Tax=Baekduia soli TaxID=496014 RepID=UPI001651EF71|nr:glycosyltransferase [Baekduia soli]
MTASVAVVIPTAARPDYLEVALASIAPQAARAGADVLVVDDGPSTATRDVARRHGARYVAHEQGGGLNAARNTGARETTAPLLAYVDDDVEVRPGWLDALVAAAAACPDEVGVFTGPILARIEDHPLRLCGREDPPVTHLDLGPQDRDCEHAWGANMAVRRSALERVGPFDEARELYGDEQEWQARLKAGGGRLRYVAAAALDHRRAGDDARLGALCRAAYRRGRASRRFDVFKQTAPSTAHELRILAGCLAHGPRFRCANGPILAAHSLGRLRALAAERVAVPPPPPARPGVDDFLSGRSGLVAGRRGRLLRADDLRHDVAALAARRRVRRAAARLPRRRVLVVGVERRDVPNLMAAARAELLASRHDVTIEVGEAGALGKFENLDRLLGAHDLAAFDWVLVLDDDVALPRGFLDAFLACAEAGGLVLAQPAHRRHSHAAWEVTRRQGGADWRETTFVEIGPVTAFAREAATVLLPFPATRMGWGLDVHWSAVAQQRGWRIGVVDATPIGHTIRPTAEGYPRDAAAAEARRFLDGRPYLRREEARTLRARRLPVA